MSVLSQATVRDRALGCTPAVCDNSAADAAIVALYTGWPKK